MLVSKEISSINDEFKAHTGILLPVTKFLLSNALVLSVLLVIPFKVFFWVYQIGYLSVFGINYDLILRESVEAQGLWGEMLYSFADIAVYPFWFFIILCLLLSFLGIAKTFLRFNKRLIIYNRFEQGYRTNKKRSKLIRKLKILIRLSERGDKKVFNLASTSYLLSVLFFMFLLGFSLSSIYVYEKGKLQAKQRFDLFHSQGICNDGWGQSGCYIVKKGEINHAGYLVTMSDKDIYLMTDKLLLVIPKSSDVLVTRTLSFTSD